MNKPPQNNSEEDDNEVLQVSPNERFKKLRKKVFKRDFLGIDAAHLAFDTEEGILVVWNEINFKNERFHNVDKNELTRKFVTLTRLRHNNIVKFFDFWIDSDRECMVLISEYMTSGTLKTYLKKNKFVLNGKAAEKRQEKQDKQKKVWLRWCRQILSALRYLHSCDPPLVHGNIRCDSIFIQHNGVVKVGAVCLTDIARHIQSLEGADSYVLAPELLGDDAQLSTAADIYAFGMCVLEMVTNELPYAECTPPERIKNMGMNIYPASLNKVTNEGLREFIELCLSPVESRPSADALLFHPFLFEVPPLKVMVAHYILREDIDTDGAGLSAELEQFLHEVGDGVWGTLANVKLKSRTLAPRVPRLTAFSSGEGRN
eukprot:Colp12_sorted_trinity150504_noHs@22886